MQKYFKDGHLRFLIGDIRDTKSFEIILQNVDIVINTAAIKQVLSSENNPMEDVKTNIIGANNLIIEAIKSNVQKVICIYTDKSVYPSNCMGMSKGIS